MNIVLNNKEKCILAIAFGFFLGFILSMIICVYFYNNLKIDYQSKINEVYIEGFKKGKEKGIEECQEIVRDYKPFYNE